MIDAKERGFLLSKVYDDMMNGEIYWPGDEELMKQQLDCMEKLYDYNATRPMNGRSGRSCSKRC